jgi:hypothetical protein
MKHKYNNYSLKLLLLVIIATGSLFSCESDDSLLPINSATSSLAKIQSLVIKSGKNRVMVNAIVGDPNISEVRIYWDNKSDSVVLPANASNGVDTITTIIDNLQENLYIFEAQAFNEEGKSSKPVSGGADVFGSNYSSSLVNRPIITNELIGSILDISFGKMDMSSGVRGTELIYENTDGENQEIYIKPDKDDISLQNFKTGSTFRYRNVFVPALIAIDTFYTEYSSYRPKPFPVLKNASSFEVAESSGRWGNLADWIANEAVKNHDGFGGYDSKNGFNIESGWGAPGITNGKIYQTVTAGGAANYTLNVEFDANNYSESDEGGYYIIIAKGDGLPDVEDIATAPEVLGYQRVTSSEMNYNIDFTVEETMEISIGILTTQSDSGRYGPIKYFELVAGTN